LRAENEKLRSRPSAETEVGRNWQFVLSEPRNGTHDEYSKN